MSEFGFAYDHYGQETSWHVASEGLRTIEALRGGLEAQQSPSEELRKDLETLASVMEVAAQQDVRFSLVLRLHANDSLQAVCTRENRQGSFW